MKTKNLSIIFSAILLFILSAGMIPKSPEEGMYPLSEIKKIDLIKAGLKINPLDVYNPDGISLVDALVKVGGCTGSFISDEGLILTNHHCAFSSINRASSAENNYLENGFLAKNKSYEIPAYGLTVRITESYEDVSDSILNAVKNIDDTFERIKEINKQMEMIGRKATDKENNIEGKVSEMFKGKTYILFKYRMIKDVRIVYAPPRSVGEFGGETDNWVWPRHTGDFTFMRAYVAPDGSAKEYSKENIPFHPKRFLKVNPNGVKEGDFTFILGYPGRTYRHLPSYFLQYQENYQLPYVSKTYEWMINELETIAGDSEKLKLKFATPIKRLANTMKNYKGKLKGLKRINLVEQKQQEEEDLQNFISQSPELKSKYGNLLSEFNSTYNELFKIGKAYLWFRILNRFSTTKVVSDFIIEYCKQMKLPDNERKSKYRNENIDNTKKIFYQSLTSFNKNFENSFLTKMINDGLNFNNMKINSLSKILNGNSIHKITTGITRNSKYYTKPVIDSLLLNCPNNLDDSFFRFAKLLNEDYETIKKEYDRINGSINKLSAQLYDVKKLWKKTNFIPDANGTLRLTYGYIKGYSPADAIYMSPITTLDGVIDKSLLGGEYIIPDKLKTLYVNKDFGQFYNNELGSVPVGILYNMDTTGGNSGSPIMNAYGEMIGINFDRAYEATINDFAWNESYSRSIGVDIRYVLWITQKLGGADYLLAEMGVD